MVRRNGDTFFCPHESCSLPTPTVPTHAPAAHAFHWNARCVCFGATQHKSQEWTVCQKLAACDLRNGPLGQPAQTAMLSDSNEEDDDFRGETSFSDDGSGDDSAGGGDDDDDDDDNDDANVRGSGSSDGRGRGAAAAKRIPAALSKKLGAAVLAPLGWKLSHDGQVALQVAGQGVSCDSRSRRPRVDFVDVVVY
jgi:hypothetical protein